MACNDEARAMPPFTTSELTISCTTLTMIVAGTTYGVTPVGPTVMNTAHVAFNAPLATDTVAAGRAFHSAYVMDRDDVDRVNDELQFVLIETVSVRMNGGDCDAAREMENVLLALTDEGIVFVMDRTLMSGMIANTIVDGCLYTAVDVTAKDTAHVALVALVAVLMLINCPEFHDAEVMDRVDGVSVTMLEQLVLSATVSVRPDVGEIDVVILMYVDEFAAIDEGMATPLLTIKVFVDNATVVNVMIDGTMYALPDVVTAITAEHTEFVALANRDIVND